MDRLLWDCETVGLAIADRVPASERLRRAVGEDLAGLLVAGLAAGGALTREASSPPSAEPGRAA